MRYWRMVYYYVKVYRFLWWQYRQSNVVVVVVELANVSARYNMLI